MAEQTGADSAAAAEQLALLLSSANLGSEGGTNGAWLTQTDILTTDNLDFEGVLNGGGGRQGKAGISQQQREADPFLDSAQELESVYSSHMSSAQDIMSSMHSQEPNLFLSTDPNNINAAGGHGDGPCDPAPRSLSASLAHDAIGEAGTSAGASHRSGGPNARDGAQASPRKAQRGQGYRRLWQQVTKVSKGQKLQDNLGLAFSDMTVRVRDVFWRFQVMGWVHGCTPEERCSWPHPSATRTLATCCLAPSHVLSAAAPWLTVS